MPSEHHGVKIDTKEWSRELALQAPKIKKKRICETLRNCLDSCFKNVVSVYIRMQNVKARKL